VEKFSSVMKTMKKVGETSCKEKTFKNLKRIKGCTRLWRGEVTSLGSACPVPRQRVLY